MTFDTNHARKVAEEALKRHAQGDPVTLADFLLSALDELDRSGTASLKCQSCGHNAMVPDDQLASVTAERDQLVRGIERLEDCIVIAPVSPSEKWQAWTPGTAFKCGPDDFDTASELISKLGAEEQSQ